MNEYFSIKDLGEYKVYLAPRSPERTEARAAAGKAKRDALNNAYLASHPFAGKPAAPITGSFIYSRPPNYCGLCTLKFTKDDWKRELSRLKSYGMDTVIFQAALWSDLEECYYPSKKFSHFRTWNVLEPMMEAVKELGLTLYLGGYGSVTCWKDKLQTSDVRQEVELQLGCYEELLKYKDNFQGFYFTSESAFIGKRDPEAEYNLGELYGQIFDTLREWEPNKKILMSPATFYYEDPAVMSQMADAWCAMFHRAHPDILAPQDSIGCGCITLDHQQEGLALWADVCKRCGIHFWSNVEVFECCAPFLEEHARQVAPVDRVLAQIAHAAPLTEKLITWEALWYFSDQHPKGQELAKVLFSK